MKTPVQIPAVGECPAFLFDPMNRAHVRALVRRCEAYFSLSAKAWEEGDTEDENAMAANGAALLEPLGIRLDWPGLYPTFHGEGFHEYNALAAVERACGHPYGWTFDTETSR